tara:strand:+ start:1054 stop:1380 length:327 start_codon:yes stop_codon:yes gene_type:complete
MSNIDDLLEIPDFLRRDFVPSDNVPKREPKREPKRRWIMPSKTKSKPKRKKSSNISESDRYILRSLGWTDKVLKAMPKKDIEAVLNKPRYMQAVDEIAYLQKGKAANA